MGDRLLTQSLIRLLTVATLILLLLTGCQPTTTVAPDPSPAPPPTDTPAPTETPSRTTILTVWHSWDADEEEVFRGLLADYQAEHPGVTVRLRRVPVDRIQTEYEEAVLSGEGPELLVGRSDWIGGLAERQIIAPLDDLLGEEYWDGFYPFALEGVRLQGRRYAVPYAGEAVALYYNRDFVSDPPTTTSALVELAATWPGEQDAQAGLAFPLSFYNTVGYLYAFGGRLLDEAGQVALETIETEAWLNWLLHLQESPGVIATQSFGQADARFKSGTVAMVVNGSWFLSDYVRALGRERLGVTPLPMLNETRSWPTPYVGYYALMVNPLRLQDHPEDTLELLRFLGGPFPQQLLAGRLNMIPTWSQLDLSGDPLLAAFVQQAEIGRPRPVTLREQMLWDPIDKLLGNVTNRRLPVAAALQETQQSIEQMLLEMGGGAP